MSCLSVSPQVCGRTVSTLIWAPTGIDHIVCSAVVGVDGDKQVVGVQLNVVFLHLPISQQLQQRLIVGGTAGGVRSTRDHNQ